MSAERFAALDKRASLCIYFGPRYVYSTGVQEWKVNVEFHDGGAKIEFEQKSQFLDVALALAYDRLDQIVSRGLGASAMLPAIEHQPEVLS